MSESEKRGNESKVLVLLVDDNELLLQAMVAVLSHMAVTPCRNAKQALLLLEESTDYDVIVSDMRMPDIPGPEFYARVLERWPKFAERFVFITGDNEGAARLIAACGKRSHFAKPPIVLLKPVMPEELTQAIFTAIERAEAGTNGTHRTVNGIKHA